MLIKYEDVVNFFNDYIQNSHLCAFSSMSHYFWTWSQFQKYTETESRTEGRTDPTS